METIEFSRIMPRVFSTLPALSSEIWGREVTFRKGESCLLLADSGKGKSTFCSYLLGYRNDYSGTLRFDADDTAAYDIPRWTQVRQRQVSLLFQELRLFPELTAHENVEIKNALTHHLTETTVREWFDRLGIADKWDAPVGKMSFGQQQRVALIRALAQPFDFLVLDEPISHLDDTNGAMMAQLVEEEVRRQGAALIVTSIGKHFDIHFDHTLQL